MATTKIHPIKSTLNLAIKYISNENKTDEKVLISTSNCEANTAHLRFLRTREFHMTKGSVLARHLIQSFFPGEVSPEQAHEIGKELCNKVLGNNYEYVLTTHIDRGHIHNHIIFNNVSFVTGKCYQSNKRSYHQIRKISDDLCKENDLIVIDEYYEKYKKKFKTNGKSYKEYTEDKKGNSWKSKLQFDIDRAIEKSKSWEEFLSLMEKYEYEIKYGKHIAFKHRDKERFTRAKTIGDDYTETRIKERILEQNSHAKKVNTKGKSFKKIIDTSTQKMKENKGLEFWATKENLKLASETLSEIKRMGIKNTSELDDYVKEKLKIASDISDKIKNIESEIKAKSDIMELANEVLTFKKYHDYVIKNPDDKLFRNEYKSELESYKKALSKLKEKYPNKMPNTKDIYKELEALHKQKETLYTEYSSVKDMAFNISQKRKIMEDYMKKDVER